MWIIILLLLLIIAGIFFYFKVYRAREYPSKPINVDTPAKDWVWVPECKKSPKFIINSEWPTFLDRKAWNSCQGCKSAGGSTDSTSKTFQIIGDWMRISCIDGQDSSLVSTAESQDHWFNPPRNDTNDDPLEIEWYMYMDASTWKDQDITSNNWSAFWAFGHGKDQYAWPSGGELDLVEWLPSFGSRYGKGLATGIHNNITGAYPPCCMKRDDPVSYPSEARLNDQGQVINIDTDPVSGFTFPREGGFNNWGILLKDKINPDLTTESEQLHYYDKVTYNNVLHCYARMTTSQFSIWAKTRADPRDPPKVKVSRDMTNSQVNELLAKYGYKMVSNTFADYGSNNDLTYWAPDGVARKPTNWHQNMFFVWSAILSQGNRRMDANDPNYNNSLVFYLSDIHLRGGGNYKKAMLPPGAPETDRDKVFGTDPTSAEACKYRWANDANICNTRLSGPSA